MKYVTTYNEALTLRDSINESIIASGRWKNTKTTNLCDVELLHSGEGALPIIAGYEQYYPEHVLQQATEVKNWHEDKNIQIVQSYDDLLEMLELYPEIAVYRRDNNIQTHKENNKVYVYVNELFQEHRDILESFNAKIKDV